MITVLLVARRGQDLSWLAGRNPSVEVLLAQGADEAVEKLARNRRIDAVLLLAGEETVEIASAIQEDNPAPPPLFLPETSGSGFPGARRLPAEEPARLLELLAQTVQGLED